MCIFVLFLAFTEVDCHFFFFAISSSVYFYPTTTNCSEVNPQISCFGCLWFGLIVSRLDSKNPKAIHSSVRTILVSLFQSLFVCLLSVVGLTLLLPDYLQIVMYRSRLPFFFGRMSMSIHLLQENVAKCYAGVCVYVVCLYQ